MIQLTPQMRIFVAVEAADFRKGIDGLCQVCRSVLKSNHSRDTHKENTLVPIGDILKSLAIPTPLASPLPTHNEPQTVETLQKRISALESLVKSSTEKIALIEL